MLFYKSKKLDPSLKHYLNNNCYKKYRVLIECSSLQDGISKRINSYRDTLVYSLENTNLICAILKPISINKLLEYPEVSYIYLDQYLFLCGLSISSANYISSSLKDSKYTGKGISIGIIDSGVYPHKDLISPTNRISFFKDLINNYSFPYDDNGHGTAISGIVAGNGASSDGIYKGIAPNSNLYCYKAFDRHGKGLASNIIYSLDSLIQNNINILCMPFELLNHSIFLIKHFNNLFSKAIGKNIIPIVPSGSNFNSPESIMGIATLDTCITVGGVDTSKKEIQEYTYSSSGPYKKLHKPDLSAACVNIVSLNSNTSYISEKNNVKLYPPILDINYTTFTGTSISCAYIAGLCALLLENNPSLKFKDILTTLKISCDSKGLSKEKVGNGIINILKLLYFFVFAIINLHFK